MSSDLSDVPLLEEDRQVGSNDSREPVSMPDSFLQVLLDCAWDIFAVLDVNGRVRYVSPSNYTLLGYAQEDLVGQNGFDLVHPDDRPRLEETFETLREDPDTPITLKHRFRAADGSWRVLESTLQNKLDHADVRGWVIHARDVSDRDRLHAELGRTQQHLRRLQLHPHFVLNVLHTIQAQLLSDPEAAAETIADFGDLLRLSYAHVDSPMVPLGHEVEFVERYVALYQHRFDDPIGATFEVPEDLRSVLVPTLLLQPIVENALRHGLRPAQGGRLTVKAQRIDDQLRLTVLDDGVGLAEVPTGEEGLGLSTTRTRLRQVYGPEATLRLEAAPDGGTVATVVLPFAPEEP